MGIIKPDFYLFRHYISQYSKINNKNYSDIKMLELGNQIFQDDTLIREESLPHSAKEYYMNMGVEHTSIDLNGEDGALQIDLSKPIPEEYNNKFDIVTNFGTAEHVDNQFECWRNIHNSLKKKWINFIIISYD